jgi:hypothetical protein
MNTNHSTRENEKRHVFSQNKKRDDVSVYHERI